MDNHYKWNQLTKISFRFTFVFSILFIFLKNNGAFPFFRIIVEPLSKLSQIVIPWFAKNILHYQYDYSISTNGSGDTSYDWMMLIFIVFTALLATTIWSLLDAKRKNYNILYYWMTVVIRYYVAFMLFNYGLIKLFHAQMPPPSLGKLMQPLHEFSPMGLAWTYLGFSKGFNIFMGIVEIAALLLIFRRTMVLGAIITLATSINIMSVNYFFDVPVKLVSTILFLFSFILLIPNIKSLYQYFILNKPSSLKLIEKPISKKLWLNKINVIGKFVIIILFFMAQYFSLKGTQMTIDKYYKKSELYGIYQVDNKSNEQNNFPKNWKYIVLEFEGYGSARDTNYERLQLDVGIDKLKKIVRFDKLIFKYAVEKNGDIILTTEDADYNDYIRLKRIDEKSTILLERKFNLIQEYPFNR